MLERFYCSFDPTDNHIWLELYTPPSDKDVELLGSVCLLPIASSCNITTLRFVHEEFSCKLIVPFPQALGFFNFVFPGFPVMVRIRPTRWIQLDEYAGWRP